VEIYWVDLAMKEQLIGEHCQRQRRGWTQSNAVFGTTSYWVVFRNWKLLCRIRLGSLDFKKNRNRQSENLVPHEVIFDEKRQTRWQRCGVVNHPLLMKVRQEPI